MTVLGDAHGGTLRADDRDHRTGPALFGERGRGTLKERRILPHEADSGGPA